MNSKPASPRLRRSLGLAAIAIAVAVGPYVLGRSRTLAGEPPLLPAPEIRVAVPRASQPPAGTPRTTRTRPPRLLGSANLPDDAGPIGAGRNGEGARAGTEREYHERFLATLRAGDDARRRLEERAPDVLRSPGGSAQKVALLRALRDVGSPALPGMLELALRELPDVSGPHGVSVPAFVVNQLGRADRISSAERAILERAVHNSSGGLAPSTRGRALRVLVGTADEARRPALTSVVQNDPDPLVRAMGEQELRSLPNRKDLTEE